jgi:hypothetical protein
VRAEVESVAVPWLTAVDPSNVAPSKNPTEPVALSGEMVAVNVTSESRVAGLRLEDRLVDVFAFSTTCESALEELGSKSPLPLYAAVIE